MRPAVIALRSERFSFRQRSEMSCRRGVVIKSRLPTREIIAVNAPGRDAIVSRVIWLRGKEAGNRNAHERCIYIHGTPEEKRGHRKRGETSPVKHLESELQLLRRDLRATVRAYAARLEIGLAESVATLNSYKPADELSRERLHQVRDLTIMLRNRKVKPEKGRRKDLRKIDSLITDLHLFMQNGVS